jgi:hypothetical protein
MQRYLSIYSTGEIKIRIGEDNKNILNLDLDKLVNYLFENKLYYKDRGEIRIPEYEEMGTNAIVILKHKYLLTTEHKKYKEYKYTKSNLKRVFSNKLKNIKQIVN